MVRNYKPKTDRRNIDEQKVKTAISEVLSKTLSIRKAAEKYGIKAATLQHRIEKLRKQNEQSSPKANYGSKYTVAQVFSTEQEKSLSDYLLNSSKMHYGLSLNQVMVLAYEYAECLGCKYPESWKANKRAGKDWVAGFRHRNQDLSLRKPENTSAARSFAFNKTAVNVFFDNYERVMTRYKFTPDRVINLDETGITTVLPTPKVLAERKQRQVGQIVSAERGELVTFCGIVTSTGAALPPVFVFPRVHYKEYFLNGAPEGSLGLANRSGWINSELHIEVLRHIQRHTLCTKENPILIICDNHESHISIEAVNYCRENGIVYLSLPPHTSHKMQPLDVCIFGPFKSKLKIAFNDWHLRNVGKTLSIYNIAELTKSAFLESFTPKNITSGFSRTGIWPFNRLVFGDDDFAPIQIFDPTSQDIGNVTDEANEENEQRIGFEEGDVSKNCEEDQRAVNEPDSQGIRLEEDLTLSPNNVTPYSDRILSPEVVRPYPKTIIGSSSSKKGREKGKSRILTDTPEKDRLQSLHEEKIRKQQVKLIIQKAKELKTARNLLGLSETKPKVKRRRSKSNSDTSYDESVTFSDHDDEDDIDIASDHENSDLIFDVPNPENVNVDDFLLIKFEKKKNIIYYVAKVISKTNLTDYQVSHLRTKAGSCTFVFPNVEDKADVDFEDVVLQLPKPNFSQGTSRTSSLYTFPIDLSGYNIQ